MSEKKQGAGFQPMPEKFLIGKNADGTFTAMPLPVPKWVEDLHALCVSGIYVPESLVREARAKAFEEVCGALRDALGHDVNLPTLDHYEKLARAGLESGEGS